MSKASGVTRRFFLRTGFLASASALTASKLVARARVADSPDCATRAVADGRGPILVHINLAGGNDGLNTVIPYADEEYFSARASLAIPPSRVLKISGELGLHGALSGLRKLYDLGELAVILGVGYPDPSRAHFRAREIWRTGRVSKTYDDSSWVERSLGASQCLGPEAIVRMTRKAGVSGSHPCSHLASGLDLVARLIAAEAPVRAFCLNQEGYDTHVGQLRTHQRLLDELDSALSAFVAKLRLREDFGRVLIMISSEFGRCLAANSHGGTEHGSAAPILIAGGALTGGIYGTQPSLTSLPGGQLAHSVDFRSVYATVLEKWFRAPARGIFGHAFPTLDFL